MKVKNTGIISSIFCWGSITDPKQKMLLLMPVFFTFIFLKFPSGLVLYWLTSNVITLTEHIILKKIK